MGQIEMEQKAMGQIATEQQVSSQASLRRVHRAYRTARNQVNRETPAQRDLECNCSYYQAPLLA